MNRQAQTGWDNAFQSRAINFLDQLIAENQELKAIFLSAARKFVL